MNVICPYSGRCAVDCYCNTPHEHSSECHLLCGWWKNWSDGPKDCMPVHAIGVRDEQPLSSFLCPFVSKCFVADKCEHKMPHEHRYECRRMHGCEMFSIHDPLGCVPVGDLIVIRHERLIEIFPTGWPVRCPNCDSWAFTYVSENTGNIRRYTCKKCNDMYLATWKGKPITNAFSEPVNTRMEQWEWARIVNRLPEGKP